MAFMPASDNWKRVDVNPGLGLGNVYQIREYPDTVDWYFGDLNDAQMAGLFSKVKKWAKRLAGKIRKVAKKVVRLPKRMLSFFAPSPMGMEEIPELPPLEPLPPLPPLPKIPEHLKRFKGALAVSKQPTDEGLMASPYAPYLIGAAVLIGAILILGD